MPRFILSSRLACPVVLSLVFAPAMARAHAILMDSHPVLGTSIDAGPTSVVLRFNSRIDAPRSRLLLIRPGTSPVVLPILPGATPDRLAAQVDLPPGEYVVRWQVLAVDGHITRGNVPFSVRAK